MVEEADDTIYQRHYVSEKKAHKFIEYEGRCQIKSNKGTDGPQRSWCGYRYSIKGRRNASAPDYRNN